MNQFNTALRVLAIDPTSRGFAFAVMEGPHNLIDWGNKSVRPLTNKKCLNTVAAQVEFFAPAVIVLENPRGSRRCTRVRRFSAAIQKLAEGNNLKVCLFSREETKATLGPDATTKHRTALNVAKRLPELADRLPWYRKAWMSEDQRTNIFDAVALALTFFGKEPRSLD